VQVDALNDVIVGETLKIGKMERMTKKHAVIAVFALTALAVIYAAAFYVIYFALGDRVIYPTPTYYFVRSDEHYVLRKIEAYQASMFICWKWKTADAVSDKVFGALIRFDWKRRLVDGNDDEKKRLTDALIRYEKLVPAGMVMEIGNDAWVSADRWPFGWSGFSPIGPAISP
jgi:hypothetical protein